MKKSSSAIAAIVRPRSIIMAIREIYARRDRSTAGRQSGPIRRYGLAPFRPMPAKSAAFRTPRSSRVWVKTSKRPFPSPPRAGDFTNGSRQGPLILWRPIRRRTGRSPDPGRAYRRLRRPTRGPHPDGGSVRRRAMSYTFRLPLRSRRTTRAPGWTSGVKAPLGAANARAACALASARSKAPAQAPSIRVARTKSPPASRTMMVASRTFRRPASAIAASTALPASSSVIVGTRTGMVVTEQD